MVFETWGKLLQASFGNIWLGVAAFLPNLIVALIIFLVGWIVGVLVGHAVWHVVKILKIDSALKDTELEHALERGGFTLNIGAFLGGLVKWFVIVVFLVASLDVLKLTQVNRFLQDVVLVYLPQVIVAVLILVAAAIIGDVMFRIVTGSARAAHIRSAHFIGSVTKWAIWIFAILAALYQLGIATPFVQTLFTGVIVAVSLAIGLAFG